MARKRKLSRWDASEYLKKPKAVAAYLEAALEDGDPQVVASVLGDLARARGMTQVAREAGVSRENLYRTLSLSGNPELGTVLRVVRALGLRLHVEVA